MQARLTISAVGFEPETIQDLTREFCRTLNAESELKAKLSSVPVIPGEKGAETATGAIDLEWIKVNISKFINLLKEFFTRSESIVIVLEDPSGKKATLTIQKHDLNEAHIKKLISLLEDFFG